MMIWSGESVSMSKSKELVETKQSPLEEGMYYERAFSPEKVKVFFDTIQDKQYLSKLVLEDKNGQTLEVSDKRLVSRLFMYLAKYTEGLTVSNLRALPANQLEAALNGAIEKRDKPLKALYDDQGHLCGLASTMHTQISWQKIREIVEGVIQKVTGEVTRPDDSDHQFKWAYRVPAVKNEMVSSWVGVHAGNNIIQGRSGIRIFSRFRTERGSESGGVKRPACLNWCGMWQFPEQMFGVNMKRLDNIAHMIGKENVQNIQMLQFHLRADLDEFQKDLETGIQGLVKSMQGISVVIDKSIHSFLSKAEMQNILEAYQTKSKSFLPDYIVEQIMKHVDEETVWGFSNAVSWVRTHGEFKFTNSSNAMFKSVEDRDLTWRLENIAGEVLSLTPTINDIHKKHHGEITLEFLVGEEQAKALRAAKLEKLSKQIIEVPAVSA